MLKIEPSGIVGRFCSIVAVIMTIYHLWAINFGYFEPYLLNVTHIAFVFTLSFFLYATWGKKKHKYELLIDAILTILGLSSSMYIYINYYTMVFQRRTVLPNDVDIFFSLLGMVLLLELTRRAVGLPLFFIALIFIGYVFLGQYIPGPLHHGGFDLDRIVSLLYLSYEGMLGTILTVITSIVMMFIIFSATLREFGGGKFVTDAAFSLTGHMDGGPAKVAVVASAAFGTISGSAVSNVVATGTFTIPMMKKLGYKPHFAGAVEAAASTGGQIMPPIMGAAAFIMAEMTATPYHIIAFLAIIPAIYYFLCIFLSVHFEAKKLGLRGLSKKELPNIWNVIKWGGHLLPPFIFLVYLIYTGYPIKRAAFYCIILLIIFSLLRKTTRPSLKNFYNAFKTASYEILMISIACSAAGAVMGVLNLTGVGIRLAIFLIELSGNNLVLLLLMTAIVCIILGMGVPPVAAYAIPAAIMAPA
ncbi:MAG: TRAP transporter fused permease subunit, partial [Nitrososphaerales archaeon]